MIILVGIQALLYTIFGLIYLVMAFHKPDEADDKLAFCVIKHELTAGSIISAIIVIATLFISMAICIGVFLLVKLHIKLMRFDFTTFEYIQYLDDRKTRVSKLKNKRITKAQFDELEK